jgi:hypothetical protein
MGQVLVRDLSLRTVLRLKRRGRSLQAEAKAILERAELHHIPGGLFRQLMAICHQFARNTPLQHSPARCSTACPARRADPPGM